MALRFYEEAKEFFRKTFSTYDSEKRGMLSFTDFTQLMKKLDPLRPQWKVIALFE